MAAPPPNPTSTDAPQASGAQRGTFPDPSITIVELGDALGALIASTTERDGEKRRLALKKVAYIRFDEEGWGAAAYPEVWIEQSADGLYSAYEARSGKVFRHPSRRRYEVAFISRSLFDCAIQCLKERQAKALMELLFVTFSDREGFSIQQGGLSAPEDYASEMRLEPGKEWVAPPNHF